MKNKNQMIYMIIFIAVAIISVVGATYAYFESITNLDDSNFNVQAITAGSTSFTGYSTGNIEFNVAFSQMSQANVSDNIVATDNAVVNISLESENENVATTCTYDLVWVWDGESKYTEADTDLPYLDEQSVIDGWDRIDTKEDLEKEYELYIETFGEDWKEAFAIDYGYGEYLPILYKYEMSVQVDNGDEIDLSKLTWNGNEAVVAHKSITSMAGVKTNHNYEVKVNVYNIPVVQDNLYNKNFNAHIEVRNSNCSSKELNDPIMASALIKSKYTEDGVGGIYLHDGMGTYENASLEAGDNSYRYAGANPDNYVCFEGDDCLETNNLYRIIGVFGDQVKLIKRTELVYMPWELKEDESYSNVWEGSQIERYLNSTEEAFTYYTWGAQPLKTITTEGYLHSLGTKVNMIADTQWIVSGGPWTGIANSTNAQQTYNYEIAETCADCTNKEARETYTAKIGLMYVSDYYYASTPNNWNLSGWNGSDTTKDYRVAKESDWLIARMYGWTISSFSDTSNLVFSIPFVGFVHYDAVDSSRGARPSFSLLSSVKIKMGSGTADDPYVIGL